MKDYYSILGIQQNASEMLIKSRYKELAAIYHPDKNPDNTDKFIDLNEAYKTLMNRELRESYDRDFKEYYDLQKSQTGGVITPYRTRLRNGGNVNMEIDFTDYFANQSVKNDEIITKVVLLQKYIKCPDCDGSGREKETLVTTCPQCNGAGVVKNRDTKVDDICLNCNGYGDVFLYKCETCDGMGRIKTSVEVTLNFKIDELLKGKKGNGNVIVFKGQGNEGVFGGSSGDLTVLIKIDDDVMNKASSRVNGFFLKRLFVKK